MEAKIVTTRVITQKRSGKKQFEALVKINNNRYSVREDLPSEWPFLDSNGEATISQTEINSIIAEVDDKMNAKINELKRSLLRKDPGKYVKKVSNERTTENGSTAGDNSGNIGRGNTITLNPKI